MREIVLARIDDRLIHGQVVTAWMKHVNANSIVIVDDELSKNKLMQRIYLAAAPSSASLKILTIEEATAYLLERDSASRVLVLVKVPQILEVLITNGVKLEKIILGGMGSNSTRKKLIRNVFANDAERESLQRLFDNGISIHYQLVPDEKITDLRNFL